MFNLSLSEIMWEFNRVHKKHMQDFTSEYGLIALMSFMFVLSLLIAVVLIPFTLYMGLPLTVDFLIPFFFGIVPFIGWGRVFKKYLKFRYTKQFYPERLI